MIRHQLDQDLQVIVISRRPPSLPSICPPPLHIRYFFPLLFYPVPTSFNPTLVSIAQSYTPFEFPSRPRHSFFTNPALIAWREHFIHEPSSLSPFERARHFVISKPLRAPFSPLSTFPTDSGTLFLTRTLSWKTPPKPVLLSLDRFPSSSLSFFPPFSLCRSFLVSP